MSHKLQDVRRQDDRCGSTNEAKLDHARLGWAWQVLEEEARYPLTHSPARIRRAKNIVSSPQTAQYR